MNKLIIIGNLVRDPELRTTTNGKDVCSFTVAVNKKKGNTDEADFFRVSAWEGLAKICSQYLAKGRKVAVTGPVGVHTYQNNKGETVAQMDVTADDVEFLSPKGDRDAQTGYQKVEPDDLPY